MITIETFQEILNDSFKNDKYSGIYPVFSPKHGMHHSGDLQPGRVGQLTLAVNGQSNWLLHSLKQIDLFQKFDI